MRSELENKLKIEMGYVEEVRMCRNCVHHKEINGSVDKVWEHVCAFNVFGFISVKLEAHCNNWVSCK